MSEPRAGSLTGRDLILLALACFGIFIYGLISALPGSVLPTLERSRYLPDDSAVATFLLINAVGALVAYLVSGPVIDRVGMGLLAVVAASALMFLLHLALMLRGRSRARYSGFHLSEDHQKGLNHRDTEAQL